MPHIENREYSKEFVLEQDPIPVTGFAYNEFIDLKRDWFSFSDC